MRTISRQIHFPLRGIEKVSSFHDIAQEGRTCYSTHFALNVRGRDALSGRFRGGSRPGIYILPDIVHEKIISQHQSCPVVSQTASAGSAPPAATIGCVYRARCVVAVGNVLYFSRVGVHDDWNYGASSSDLSRAVSFVLSPAGMNSQKNNVTAVIPVNDRLLYIATAESIWVLSGDPCGGALTCISSNTGIVPAVSPYKLFCYGDNDRIYFLSHRGLCVMSGSEAPVILSESVPDFPTDAKCMGFDPSEKAVCVVVKNQPNNPVWFVDVSSQTPVFWFETYANPWIEFGILDGKMVFRVDDRVYNTWWCHNESIHCEMPSKVLIGPFRTSASDGLDGLLARIGLNINNQANGMRLSFSVGKTAEDATARAVGEEYVESYSIEKFKQITTLPLRVRGAWCVVTLSAESAAWGFDSCHVTCKSLGGVR